MGVQCTDSKAVKFQYFRFQSLKYIKLYQSGAVAGTCNDIKHPEES